MRVNFNSIKARIIISTIFLSVLTIILIGSISIFQSIKVLSAQAKNNLLISAKKETAELSRITDEFESVAKSMGCFVQGTLDQNKINNPAHMKHYDDFLSLPIKSIGTSGENTLAFYVYFNIDMAKDVYGTWYYKKDGNFIRMTEIGVLSEFSNPNDPSYAWYFDPIKEKKGVWLDPYVDTDVNIEMISYVEPIIMNNKIIGVSGLDLSFADMTKFVKNIKLYKTNKVILLNNKYNVLASTQFKLNDNLGKVEKGKYKFLVDGSKNKKNGIIDKGNELTAFSKLDNGFSLFISVSKSEIFKEVNNLLGILLFAMFIVIAISGYIAYTIGNRIVKPIEDLTKTSLRIADNDLTVQIQNTEDKTEIGELNRGFKKFIQNLKFLIEQIILSVKQLSEKSDYMTNEASLAIDKAETIAESISQLVIGAQDQARSVENSLLNISNMSEVIQNISKSAENTVKIAKGSETSANKGTIESTKAVDKINLICDSVSKTKISIVRLNELSLEIGQIVDIIKNIASQTNLLALNAAIEAARAGEHGKGFAVVSDEVKTLAEQSAKASDKIINMIKEIQNESTFIVKEMNENEELVKEGVSSVQSVGNSLKDIFKDAKIVENQIEEINNEIKKLASNSQEVVTMMENISAISEETAASLQEISEITENQKESLKVIGGNSNSLSEMAKTLENHIKVFKI